MKQTARQLDLFTSTPPEAPRSDSKTPSAPVPPVAPPASGDAATDAWSYAVLAGFVAGVK